MALPPAAAAPHYAAQTPTQYPQYDKHMAMSPAERRLRAQLGAYTSWANTPDRAMRLAPARAGFEARFDRIVIEKHGVLPPEDHIKCVEAERKRFFAEMALKSARARRKRAAGNNANDDD